MYKVLAAAVAAAAAKLLSHARLLVTPWTGAYQASPSMGFSRQEYWSRVPFPPPRDHPDAGIEPSFPASLALAGGFFTTEPSGKPLLGFKQGNHKFQRRRWHPTPVLLPGKSHGRRSLVGCSP